MKKNKLLSLILALVILFSEFGSFSAITKAEDVNEPVVEEEFIIQDGVLTGISDKKKEEISLSGEVVIPDEVTEIGPHVFQGLGLTSVTLGSSLEKLELMHFLIIK